MTPPQWDYTCVPLAIGAGDLNLGPHTYEASTLPSMSSHQPPSLLPVIQ